VALWNVCAFSAFSVSGLTCQCIHARLFGICHLFGIIMRRDSRLDRVRVAVGGERGRVVIKVQYIPRPSLVERELFQALWLKKVKSFLGC
jgi:hypothetical protein